MTQYKDAPAWQQPASLWDWSPKGGSGNSLNQQFQTPQMPSLASLQQWGGNPQSTLQSLGQNALGSNAVSDFDFANGAFGAANTLAPGGQGNGLSFMDYVLGGKAQDGTQTLGVASPLIGLGKGIMDGYLGLQNLELARDSFEFQKDAFSKQFENQRTLTNAQLRDRQRARNSSGGGYQSTDAYMAQNGV